VTANLGMCGTFKYTQDVTLALNGILIQGVRIRGHHTVASHMYKCHSVCLVVPHYSTFLGSMKHSDLLVNEYRFCICFSYHYRAHNFTNFIQKFAKCDEQWKMLSSGMWRHVDLVWTNVSEECIVSICPEYGGNTFVRNVSSHKIYMAPHPRRQHSS
jgi:hypothetical protein